MQTIILGGGCFWCTESVFLSVKGVQSVVSGYMGGDAVSANYEAVCGGDTGHVEVIKVEFDESIAPLEVVLMCFLPRMTPPPWIVKVTTSAANTAAWFFIPMRRKNQRSTVPLTNYVTWALMW